MTEAILTSARSFAPNEDVVARTVGDDVILLDLEAGTYYSLNAVGATVWQGIADGETSETIAARIAGDYDITAERALADIGALIGDLAEKGLVVQR
jgi:hypothetical protein